MLVLGLAAIVGSSIRQRTPNQMTFEACAEAGGEAWRVDLFHPDICPSCAGYEACAREHNDYSDVCPECYGPCQACQDRYSLYEECPECYGPCQTCQNDYLNDFASEDERYRLCPECRTCDACREDLEAKRSNCPPCVACRECKEANTRETDIRDACPQIETCTECMNRNFPYPDACPDGREKVGEISDAAIWFQCCR
jgi:hypothetical protein